MLSRAAHSLLRKQASLHTGPALQVRRTGEALGLVQETYLTLVQSPCPVLQPAACTQGPSPPGQHNRDLLACGSAAATHKAQTGAAQGAGAGVLPPRHQHLRAPPPPLSRPLQKAATAVETSQLQGG